MAKSVSKEKPIVWQPKLVKLEELRENLNNPKIITESGKKKLHKSLDKFGLAGTIVVNADMTIIDGHSRKSEFMERGITEVWVSVPDRELTEAEYKEMNAVFDAARASDVDMFMVGNMFDDVVLDEWGFNGEKKSGKNGKGDKDSGLPTVGEPRYPIVPKYDEKYEAIVIVCSNVIDTTFIKNVLGIGQMMSYKNKTVKETSVIPSKQFIEKWRAK